ERSVGSEELLMIQEELDELFCGFHSCAAEPGTRRPILHPLAGRTRIVVLLPHGDCSREKRALGPSRSVLANTRATNFSTSAGISSQVSLEHYTAVAAEL